MVHCHAQLVYKDTKRVFTVWSKSLLTNASSSRMWCATVKMGVFDASSSLPILAYRGGKPVWSLDKNASLLSSNLTAKQSRDSFQQPHSFGPSPVLCTVAYQSNFVRSLLLNLYPSDENDPDGIL